MSSDQINTELGMSKSTLTKMAPIITNTATTPLVILSVEPHKLTHAGKMGFTN